MTSRTRSVRLPRLPLLAGAVVLLLSTVGLGTATGASPELVDRAVEAGINYPTSPLGSTPTWDVSVVDFDNDGDQDFHVSLHMKHEGMLFRNNGDGTFTRVAYTPGDPLHTLTPRIALKLQYIDRHGCAWGDANGDGMPDIACAAGRYKNNIVKNANSDDELFLQGTGEAAGTFTEVALKAGVNEPCGRGRYVTFLDANGDGWDDLFVGNAKERNDPTDPCNLYSTNHPVQERHPVNELSKLYLNAGLDADGTWLGYRFDPAWNTIGKSSTVGFQYNAGIRCAITWDYNHDGRDDLLACGWERHRPYLYRNDGTKFTEVGRTKAVNLASPNVATVGDLDGDGIADYLFSDDTGFFYRLGTPTGLSATTVRIGSVLPPDAIGWAMAVGDINGDGMMDVYAQVGSADNSSNPDDFVYVNTGDMTFQPYVVPSAAGRADDVAAVRIGDRDGFVVLNGKLENPVPGPVQFIEWNG